MFTLLNTMWDNVHLANSLKKSFTLKGNLLKVCNLFESKVLLSSKSMSQYDNWDWLVECFIRNIQPVDIKKPSTVEFSFRLWCKIRRIFML